MQLMEIERNEEIWINSCVGAFKLVKLAHLIDSAVKLKGACQNVCNVENKEFVKLDTC